ncbi:hypothetical protein JCM3765_001219 [Sporobolomyces pararoseus]
MSEPTTTTTSPILPDALVLLRVALSSSLPISLVTISPSSPTSEPIPVTSLALATHLQFSTLPTQPVLPKSISTRFFSRPNPTLDLSLPSYDLQTLYFGYLNRDLVTAEYLKRAREEKVGFVSVTDRKLVSEYLANNNNNKEPPQGRIRELNQDEIEILKKIVPEEDLGETVSTTGVQDDNHKKREAPTTTTLESIQQQQQQQQGNKTVDHHAPPPVKKPRYNPDKNDQEKVKKMSQIIQGPQFGHLIGPNDSTGSTGTTGGGKVVDRIIGGGGATHHTRETVLRGERYNNFDSVRSLIGPRLKTLQEALNNSTSTSSSTIPQPGSLKPLQSSKKKQLNPIIMISPSQTALITMHNVKDFLQDSKFIPSDQAKLLNSSASGTGGYVTEDVVQINHARASNSSSNSNGRIETRMARYFIVDSVEALSKFGGQGGGREDELWDRVVCVMTTGQEWQFKPYKWSEPKELFHNVKGVYPQWTKDPVNSKIKSWNVSELRIDPHKRHIDKSVVAEFWRSLESWIAEKKPWLSY